MVGRASAPSHCVFRSFQQSAFISGPRRSGPSGEGPLFDACLSKLSSERLSEEWCDHSPWANAHQFSVPFLLKSALHLWRSGGDLGRMADQALEAKDRALEAKDKANVLAKAFASKFALPPSMSGP